MSGRPTAYLIDLVVNGMFIPRQEVADRLAELDAERQTVIQQGLEMTRLLAELDALRPPCPTCGGTMNHPHLTDNPCEDCVDGKVSIEQLAEFWTRKHQAPQRFEIEPSPPEDDEDDLRSVKPI